MTIKKQVFINPEKLKANPWNTNQVSPGNMEKLRKSITDVGFVSAVVVRELDNGTLEILGGQHRVEAAVQLGLNSIPVLNLGQIEDLQAKKIGLIDNSRYGADDSVQLAELLKEIKVDTPNLTEILPIQDEDLQVIMKAVSVDLETLDDDTGDYEDEHEEPQERAERPVKTHDMLKFRVPVRDAEIVRHKIEEIITREGLDDGDSLTLAGQALMIFMNERKSENE